mmetsp:Transcript_35853/g.76088  ORF Transcript_35853/g.76088 Transcript_35853/m.76088 type:complete len:218 (+) Transcript_35853:43-696(+)
MVDRKIVIAGALTVAVVGTCIILRRRQTTRAWDPSEDPRSTVIRVLKQMKRTSEQVQAMAARIDASSDLQAAYDCMQFVDPMEVAAQGLSTARFNQLLAQHEKDPEVMALVDALQPRTIAPETTSSPEEVLRLHQGMLSDLRLLLKDARTLRKPREPQRVLAAAQAVMQGRLQKRCGLSCAQVHFLAQQHARKLKANPAWSNVVEGISECMTRLTSV